MMETGPFKKKRLLVIEAHSDDSMLFAGGFLEKYKNDYQYYFVLVTASSLILNHMGYISREQRIIDYKKYVDIMEGCFIRGTRSSVDLPFDMESCLDTCPKNRLVSVIEKIIKELEPHVILTQGPSYHHDHTAVWEAVVAATRPTMSYYPENIYIIDNPSYIHSTGPHTDMKPIVYVKLSEELLERKLEIYRTCFPIQATAKDSYISEEGIKKWAKYRGMEARCEYAEAMGLYSKII
jgi:LmbE family N-acetylglucosaminyl deacetylase